MNSRLVEMITRGRLPLRDGQWIDTYNQITDPDCAGTIIAGINAKNHYYVMEEMKHETDTREIRDDKPRILDLSLCYKWYDMIESGEKTEEYREMKLYWVKRLLDPFNIFLGKKNETIYGLNELSDPLKCKQYDYVRFHRGQGSKQTMLFEYKGFNIGIGNPVWGAPEDKEVFIIKLGKRIDKKEPIVLGWTRDEKGNVVNRHPVEVANAVTAAKRDNTQNYVIEQRGHGFVPSSQKEICPTITDATFNYNNTLNNGYRIRKLTPRECFRLMGVSDADIDKIQAAMISKSQQYKMAGNSIVVNCLAAIFRQLFIGNFNKSQQTEIF